jgi:hypothetical protein
LVDTRYATIAELGTRAARGEELPTDVSNAFGQLLADTSRLIDAYTARHFYQTEAATVRYFTATSGDLLYVPDLVSVSEIATDESGNRTYGTVWATTDYDLEPYNAAEFDKPYTEIRLAPTGTKGWPARVRKGVRITGVWGWPAVPDMAREICLIESARAWAQSKAPAAVVASPTLGSFHVEPKLHPASKIRLDALVRVGIR